MSIQRKRRTSKNTYALDAKELIGMEVECPGAIFDSPGSFRGVVTGTPKRSKDRVYIHFHEDSDREYWFPVKDVKTWLIDNNAGPRQPSSATEATTDDVSAPQPTMQPSEGTEEYAETDVTEQPTTSESETSEAERFEEQEEADPGVRASPLAVQHGAEYGVPLGLTLGVLVIAGLVFFCLQLYWSEFRLSHSSIPNST